jgi:hypothetical protein
MTRRETQGTYRESEWEGVKDGPMRSYSSYSSSSSSLCYIASSPSSSSYCRLFGFSCYPQDPFPPALLRDVFCSFRCLCVLFPSLLVHVLVIVLCFVSYIICLLLSINMHPLSFPIVFPNILLLYFSRTPACQVTPHAVSPSFS